MGVAGEVRVGTEDVSAEDGVWARPRLVGVQVDEPVPFGLTVWSGRPGAGVPCRTGEVLVARLGECTLSVWCLSVCRGGVSTCRCARVHRLSV